MIKKDYEELKRFVDLKKNDKLILIDVACLFGIKPDSIKVNLIDKLNNTKVDGYRIIKTNEYCKDSMIFDNLILNNRYPNKRYDTISKKDGRKKCNNGFPIVISQDINTKDLKLEIIFNFGFNFTFKIYKTLNFEGDKKFGTYECKIIKEKEDFLPNTPPEEVFKTKAKCYYNNDEALGFKSKESKDIINRIIVNNDTIEVHIEDNNPIISSLII